MPDARDRGDTSVPVVEAATLRLFATWSAVLSLGLACAALVGWLSGRRELAALGTSTVPMTDLVMPAMSGPELARELRKARPRLRLLFISGYAADTAAEREELDGGAAFLQKPFTPDALTAKLRELLTSAAALPARG